MGAIVEIERSRPAGGTADSAAATTASSAPACASNDADARDLEAVGDLLNVPPAVVDRARILLDLLGDPGRRTILERLSRRPEKPAQRLPELTAMETPDIYHRLRSLLRRRVIMRNRHHIYSVDPASLACASRYVDMIAVAASLTARARPR